MSLIQPNSAAPLTYEHVHYWHIDNPETASGGLVGGSCMQCGAQRTFPAYIDDTYRDYGRTGYGLRLSSMTEIEEEEQWTYR